MLIVTGRGDLCKAKTLRMPSTKGFVLDHMQLLSMVSDYFYSRLLLEVVLLLLVAFTGRCITDVAVRNDIHRSRRFACLASDSVSLVNSLLGKCSL